MKAPETELEAILSFIPDIFTAERKVLYIGANVRRHDYLLSFPGFPESVTILEAFPPNVAALRERNWPVIQGDVRTWEPDTTYELVFWWHGPEHVEKDLLPGILARLRSCASEILLGMPWGKYPQGEIDGNPYERHLSSLYEKDLEDLGFRVLTVGKRDQIGSDLVAYWRGGAT